MFINVLRMIQFRIRRRRTWFNDRVVRRRRRRRRRILKPTYPTTANVFFDRFILQIDH